MEPNRKCNAQDRENDRDSIGLDVGYETLDDIKVQKSRNRLPSRACGEREQPKNAFISVQSH